MILLQREPTADINERRVGQRNGIPVGSFHMVIGRWSVGRDSGTVGHGAWWFLGSRAEVNSGAGQAEMCAKADRCRKQVSGVRTQGIARCC